MSIVAGFMVPHPPLIVEEIGKERVIEVSRTLNSYNEVGKIIGNIKPDTIIISSPHAPLYNDYFHMTSERILTGSFASFNADEVKFEEFSDLELINEISRLAEIENLPIGTESTKNTLDHGSMVPLYFIRKYLKDFKVIILGISGEPFSTHYKIGQLINKAVNNLDRKAVYIASGDLSHKLKEDGPYGYTMEGPFYDESIMNIMKNAYFDKLLNIDNQLREKASECGHRSFIMMAGVFDGLKVDSKMLSYEDTTGVGYGICSFYPKEKDDERKFLDKYLENIKNKNKDIKDKYINLAKRAITSFILDNKTIGIDNSIDQELLNKQSGVFVSIHRENALRGCIGTIYPTCNNVAEEIINNAISAATKDNRFIPIEEWELPYLDIHVDCLSKPEPINSKDELDVKKYGVIVSTDSKRGVLLPDLDGIDTVDLQIEIAKRKAGISKDEEIKLQRFKVERHK